MSLIKCSECGANMSTKDIECPNCNTPVNLEEEIHKDHIKVKSYKLEAHPLSIISVIILFVLLVCVMSSNLVFLNTIRGSLTIQQASTSTYYQEYISLYPTIIINITCISCIISCISKRLNKLSKLGYIINIIISISLFFNLYSNNIRVDIGYYLILIINTLLFIIPIKYRLKEEHILIDKKKESKIDTRNQCLENLSKKKSVTKYGFFITVLLLFVESIFIAIILTKNNNDIYKETIIQVNSDFQIKVVNNYINIRSEDNLESKVLGSVNKGDIYNVLDITSTEHHIWYKIDYKGNIGYIASPKTTPYIEELYNDKLVVNIFCTRDNENCGYLMEFILKYQKTTAKSFLIQYLDLSETNNSIVYNKIISNKIIEESIPLVVIGDNIIFNYTKDSEITLVESIVDNKDNKYNLVNELKKGNE